MLQRLPDLQKRAYLARFLVNVDVPEHMFADDEIVEVYQNLKDLQEEFKEVHKTSEKYKSQLISPNEIKKAIMQMEEDKGMLENKVESLKGKLETIDRYDDMLDAAKKLRLQQDEQVKLQDRLKEQKAQLLQAEHRLNAMVQRLNEKRQERASTTDVKQILSKLEVEVTELEKQCLEILPQQLQLKQRRMEELQQVLGEGPMSEGEIGQLQRNHQQLNREVQQLEERKRKTASNPDDKLAMFKQQANLVAKKKEALVQRLSSVSRERAAIESELAEKAGALSAAGKAPVLKGDDFRKYAAELRSKTAQYKRMTAELSELQAESLVVSRTVDLLKAQDNQLAGRLGEAEARRGVEGFSDRQAELEKISEQKAEVDEMKGKTLDEMSQVVGKINDEIKRRKHELAPQIMKLRKLRTEVRDRETYYLEKKTAYNNQKAGIDADLGNVQSEADEAAKEAAHEESQACYYESAASIARVKLKRVEDEKAGNFRRTLPDGQRLPRTSSCIPQRSSSGGGEQGAQRAPEGIKENVGGNVGRSRCSATSMLLNPKMEAQRRARAEAKDLLNARTRIRTSSRCRRATRGWAAGRRSSSESSGGFCARAERRTLSDERVLLSLWERGKRGAHMCVERGEYRVLLPKTKLPMPTPDTPPDRPHTISTATLEPHTVVAGAHTHELSSASRVAWKVIANTQPALALTTTRNEKPNSQTHTEEEEEVEERPRTTFTNHIEQGLLRQETFVAVFFKSQPTTCR